MANELQTLRVAKAVYSFAVDGGAVGVITPSITEIIPSGAIITDVKLEIGTAVTTASSGTISATAGAVLIKAAETPAVSVMGTGSNAIIDVIRAGQSSSTGTAKYVPIVATASGPIYITVATGAITAGVFTIYVQYIL